MTGRRISRWLSRKLQGDEAWALLILGLVMGCIFCLSAADDLRMKKRDALTPVTAVLGDVDGAYSRRHLQEIRLTTADGERYFIPSAVATESLLDVLTGLPSGTPCTMLTHRTTVLHLEAEGQTWVDFEAAGPRMTGSAWGFMALGAFCFAGAGVGAWKLRQDNKKRP